MKSTAKSQKLVTVLCHKGYVTPANNSQQCIGATFKKQVNDKKVTQADNEYNLKQLNTGLPNVFDWQIDDIISANAKVRACTSDHLPIVGIMPDIDGHIDAYAKLKQDSRIQIETPQPVVNNLYLLAGLGARGLCSAPLLADILAAELSGGVYPVDQAMLFNLAPNRFIIKDIIRGKVGKV